MSEFTHLNATADEDQRAPGFGESFTTTERFLTDKIKELEAQLPKVVKIDLWLDSYTSGICHCGNKVSSDHAFCHDCGSRLDFTEEEK